MDEEALARELAATYSAEAEERIEALTRLLLDLEQDRLTVPVSSQIELIYREVHSLKGAARSVGVVSTEAAAHRFEEELSRARGAAAISPPTMVAWFDQFDQLRSTITSGRKRGLDDLPASTEGLAWAEGPSTGSSVRIATDRLDRLMEDLGSLIVSEQARAEAVAALARLSRELTLASRFDHHGRSPVSLEAELTDFRERLQASVRALGGLGIEAHRQIQALDDDVQGLRMMPIKPLFLSFERMVRDLALAAGKTVELKVSGEETELDRAIVDQLHDPLIHLLRNGIDHGVETAQVRLAAGKPAAARLELAAVREGNQVVITVQDDGPGLDHAEIARRAVKLHQLAPEAVDTVSPAEVAKLLFGSGFSTRDEVTEISGRGLGLAIVRVAIERLRGAVEVASPGPGLGTRFTITVPLTLATTRCFLLDAGAETYAIPIHSTKRIVIVDRAELKSVDGHPAIAVDGQAAGFFHLAAVLHRTEVTGENRIPTFVFDSPSGLVAIACDRIRGELDLVVKAFPPAFPPIRALAGAATLASGEVVLVVDPAALVRIAMVGRREIPQLAIAGPDLSQTRPRVLVADDSLTTRTLERSILFSAGYDVSVVPDGAEAWKALQTLEFALLVSDIEMPGIDGIELTERVRHHAKLKSLPVVLVSALARQEDRLRGLDAGADAYIVKNDFRQSDLVETVGRLLGGSRADLQGAAV